jgi:hypothetical protein
MGDPMKGESVVGCTRWVREVRLHPEPTAEQDDTAAKPPKTPVKLSIEDTRFGDAGRRRQK